MKDNCGNRARNKASVSTSAQNFSYNKDKSRKDKKKKQYKDKRDSITLVFGVNAIEIEDKKRRKMMKDIKKIIYYNYNKLGHYVDHCLEF